MIEQRAAVAVYAWALSAKDWQVHALADPPTDPPTGMLATRCQRHLIACPVGVARRGEVCARCMAGGVQQLEVLPDRTAAEMAHPW